MNSWLFLAAALCSFIVALAHAGESCIPNERDDGGDDPVAQWKSPTCPGEGYCGRTEVNDTAPYTCCDSLGPDTLTWALDVPDNSSITFEPGPSSATYLRFIDRDVGYVCTGLQTAGDACNTDRRYGYPAGDNHDLCKSEVCGMNGKCLDSKQPAGSKCWPIHQGQGTGGGPPRSKSCESNVCAASVCCKSEDEVVLVGDPSSFDNLPERPGGIFGYVCTGLARGGDRCDGEDLICSSGVCNDDGRCKGLGLSAGEACQGNNEDCESGMCSLNVCIDEKLSDGSLCSNDSTCKSGGCGARSRELLVPYFDGLEFNMTRQIAEAKEAYHNSDPWPYVCCREQEWYHENRVIWSFANICNSDPSSSGGIGLTTSWLWIAVPMLLSIMVAIQ